MRLYVTGGTGLVGSNIIKVAQEQYQAEIIASLYGPPPSVAVNYTLDPLDMSDHEAVKAAIRKHKPDVVIHAAALLDQQMLHRERKLSWSIMVEGARAFAHACREIGARFIFISSDWVFDGHEALVDEDSPPFPVNFYGITKMAVERELSAMDGLNYGVARLAGVYGLNYAIPNMTRWVQGVGFGDLPNYYANCLKQGQPIRVWQDDSINDMGHPTLATDGADMVLRLAQHSANGIFHCFGSEAINRVELARRTAEMFGGDGASVLAVALPDDVRADHAHIRIPYRGVASIEKTAKTLGRRAFNVVDGLRAFKEEYDQFEKVN
jgi:dTDP-4-dehydrorhamnose reductase